MPPPPPVISLNVLRFTLKWSVRYVHRFKRWTVRIDIKLFGSANGLVRPCPTFIACLRFSHSFWDFMNFCFFCFLFLFFFGCGCCLAVECFDFDAYRRISIFDFQFHFIIETCIVNGVTTHFMTCHVNVFFVFLFLLIFPKYCNTKCLYPYFYMSQLSQQRVVGPSFFQHNYVIYFPFFSYAWSDHGKCSASHNYWPCAALVVCAATTFYTNIVWILITSEFREAVKINGWLLVQFQSVPVREKLLRPINSR